MEPLKNEPDAGSEPGEADRMMDRHNHDVLYDIEKSREVEMNTVGNTTPNKSDLEEHKEEPSDFQKTVWEFLGQKTKPYRSSAVRRKRSIAVILLVLMALLYLAGLFYACVRSLEDAMVMLVITVIVALTAVYQLIRATVGRKIWHYVCKPPIDCVSRTCGGVFKWVTVGLFVIFVVVIVVIFCHKNPQQFTSAAGLLVFVFLMYVTSNDPKNVKWRPVWWGIALQFIFGLFILRTDLGYNMFNWLGMTVESFLSFSDEGSKFLFGDPEYMHHFFAFKALPVIIYFSAVISILYHWGVMQVLIRKIAWLMQKTMQTSASESFNAAGNIFVGQTEAPLMIRSMIKDMTKSELHAVMAGGFASIAGAIIGTYVAFGISASHLITACVMSAPAALAVSKLFYPETEKSKYMDVNQLELPQSEQSNVVEAASHGAQAAIPLVLNIAGNLIAFIALLALVNGILGYIGGLLGVPMLSFEFICSYLFWPIALLMGVEPADCRKVAELVGLKTFLNEFVAYGKLSEYIRNRHNDEGEYLSVRSEIIATYALCGFSNISSIGVQLGGLSSMAPSRSKDLAEVAVRALITGSVACFMTACIAGVLYDVSRYDATAIVQLNDTAH